MRYENAEHIQAVSAGRVFPRHRLAWLVFVGAAATAAATFAGTMRSAIRSLSISGRGRTMPSENETAVAEHETPATDHTPEPAKKLTIGLGIWIIVASLAVLAVYALVAR
jgi:hypothetical protein